MAYFLNLSPQTAFPTKLYLRPIWERMFPNCSWGGDGYTVALNFFPRVWNTHSMCVDFEWAFLVFIAFTTGLFCAQSPCQTQETHYSGSTKLGPLNLIKNQYFINSLILPWLQLSESLLFAYLALKLTETSPFSTKFGKKRWKIMLLG